MNDGDTFSIDDAPGYTFKLRIEFDDDADPPWERSDGHGPVRSIRTLYGLRHQGLKRPGERVMDNGRGDYWLYDWQKACRLAREGGWNAKPYDAPNRIERGAPRRNNLDGEVGMHGDAKVPRAAEGVAVGEPRLAPHDSVDGHLRPASA